MNRLLRAAIVYVVLGFSVSGCAGNSSVMPGPSFDPGTAILPGQPRPLLGNDPMSLARPDSTPQLNLSTTALAALNANYPRLPLLGSHNPRLHANNITTMSPYEHGAMAGPLATTVSMPCNLLTMDSSLSMDRRSLGKIQTAIRLTTLCIA